MKKVLAILLSISLFQSQAFGQLGFVAFVPYQNVTLSGGGSANINVGGKLTNVGAVIANADVVYDEKTGRVSGLENDKGNMTVSAKEFEYEDLKDRNVSESKGWGVNTSLGGKLTDRGALNLAPSGSTTVSKTDKGKVTEQTTKATLGAGTITVNGVTLSNEGAEGSALAGLNRDITKSQEITKDEITGALDASVTIDNRVLLGFLKNEAKDKEGNVIYEKDENGEVIRDNDGNPVAKTTSGWQSIGNDFTNFGKNIEQVAKNLANNNIIAQVIKESFMKDHELNLKGIMNQYFGLTGDTSEILNNDDLREGINGATNLDPEEFKRTFREIAGIYNEQGDLLGKIEFSTADGIGIKDIITINLSNLDITNPNATAGIFAKVTSANANNAVSRERMASAIMDMMNYGNANTNKKSTTEWLNQTNSNGISYANSLFDRTWDTYTNNQISSLDPRLQNPVADFINDVQNKLDITLRISQGYRSIEEQNELYQRGRDENGKIIDRNKVVTNAKGGQGYHNYGLAIDIVALKGKKSDWNEVPSNKSLVDLGKENGFEWGGDFKSIKDYPHFEMNFDKNWKYYYNSELLKKSIENNSGGKKQ